MNAVTSVATGRAAALAHLERHGKNAQKTFDRIHKVMNLYRGERGHRTQGVASRKLWHAPHEIDKYLRSQSARLVNYAARYRAGMRVGTAVTEGTAKFLVNRRMNKSQQMRWSRRGADLGPPDPAAGPRTPDTSSGHLAAASAPSAR